MINPTEGDERAYMKAVIAKMKGIIEELDKIVLSNAKDLREYKEFLWENLSEMDRAEKSAVRNNVSQTVATSEAIVERKKRLRRMIDVPYFGRIDFEADGDEALPLYIGIHSLYDPEKVSNIIYDWRAPISTMFYDYELGRAGYDAPRGRVEGDILLKRQFRIRKSVMELMIENSINIDDDILQKELSTTSDERMKNIVATIQREQNAIIRNEEARTLIIQGVAGSGKTSIALHRVAYLLYRHKGQITSRDILIVSPNKVFSDYISNVLPELGEETIEETGMAELISSVLDNKYEYQTFFEQVNDLLMRKDGRMAEAVKFKGSRAFVKLMDEYMVHLENTCFKGEDIVIGRVPVASEWIEGKFRQYNRRPMRERLPLIAKDIKEEFAITFHTVLDTPTMARVRAELKKMLKLGTDQAVYAGLFEWCGHPEYYSKPKKKKVDYADLAPLAYIHICLDGVRERSEVKHLLVDEMQDYTPIQYRVLSKLFACKKTILGDACQSVNPFSSTDSKTIQQCMQGSEVMRLCKSYRSSCEITEFAQRIRANEDLVAVERHGEKPVVIGCGSEKEEEEKIVSIIKEFDKGGMNSMGVICKTEREAEELYERVKGASEKVCFLSSESAAFTDGVVVTSAHISKGLEFDEVLVPHVSAENYSDEMDRGMLYVACTRAMHRLKITYNGAISPLIE